MSPLLPVRGLKLAARGQRMSNLPYHAVTGADDLLTQGASFSRCTCIRVGGHAAMRSHEIFARRTDLRQMTPAVGAGAVTINASSHKCKRKKKRKAERRKTLILILRTLRCGSPCGAFACRRSTTALARGTPVPKAQLQARLPGT